ncbi:MAG TPA: ABC transporter permease subunit [Tepidisphaeraceae bacterium]|jgi:NitT/TauT family transport system permease protein|nr:ABC transporter permease subunit [Tepidisphaeraceae bacterium]
MPLIPFHSRRVREMLSQRESFAADIVFLLIISAGVGVLLLLGKQVARPYQSTVVISLSYFALVRYTLLSLGRGFGAYVLSLIFTLVYGTFAAHNRRAEKVMVPALDVLQALPVLAFMPGVVLTMVSLFPTRELGLEIACIIMIFTAQAWNMTFSFHGSLRGIPQPLREVAAIQRLSGWQVFKLLEVPAAMIGLVWNSMMSMAGGWFFLSVEEAFTLGKRDFRLPGIGSYMQEAIDKHNHHAQFAAVVAMMLMIVLVDQVLWRPLVVWSQRFKLEDIQSDPPQSWVLSIIRRSNIYGILQRLFTRHEPETAKEADDDTPPASVRSAPRPTNGAARQWFVHLRAAGTWIGLTALAFLGVLGGWHLVELLLKVPLYGSPDHYDWVHVPLALLASFARTSAAVLLGAAWTLPVGIIIGRSHRLAERLQPVIQAVASFPAPMLFPLVTAALLLLHVPFTIGCVALMLLGAQWYILFNVIAGATAIPNDLEEVSDVYRMSRWQCWTQLYIPCVFPYLVTGLITAMGGAWNATIVSEYVLLPNQAPHVAFGLGSMISVATNDGNYSLLAAGAVTMAFFVVLLNRVLWKRLYHLAETRFSINV